MKTKKIIFMVILFATVLIGIQHYSNAAYTPEGDWTYEVRNNEKVEITKYNGEATHVSIPNQINGYPVYRIGGRAFDSNVKTIFIPTNVEEIDTSYYGAFYECNFTKVTFANDCKITSIGGFRNMNKLTTINIPKNVTEIENEAFYGCTSLKSIVIPSGVKKIGGSAFGRCTGLTMINIPASTDDINNSYYHAFYGCDENKLVVYCPSISTAIGFAKDKGYKYKRVDNVEDFVISGVKNKTYTGKNVTLDITLSQLKNTLKIGTDYRVAYTNNKNTGKATVIITGQGKYKGKVTKTFYIVPRNVTGLKTLSQETTTLKLSWSKNSGNVTGYQIYRYDASKDEYKYVGTTTGTTYTVKNLKPGSTYKFKARAYKKVDNKNYYGAFSGVLKTVTKPSTPKITNIKSYSKKVQMQWNRISGASGYEVYMSTSKNGTYSKVGTISSGTTIKFTKSGLTKSKIYYFKVRPYKMVDNKKVNGYFSVAKPIKVN